MEVNCLLFLALKQILGCLGPYSGFQIATVVWNPFLMHLQSFCCFVISCFSKKRLSKTCLNN